jgi:hypothetical protein
MAGAERAGIADGDGRLNARHAQGGVYALQVPRQHGLSVASVASLRGSGAGLFRQKAG